MLRRPIIGLSIIFFFTSCINSKTFQRLIHTPGKYENKSVTVKGFLHLDSTESLLYANEMDFETNRKENKFLLSFNDTLAFDTSEVNNNYVEIDGVFIHSKELIETELYDGEIVNITRVERRRKK